MATGSALNNKTVGVQCLDSSGVMQGRTFTSTTTGGITITNGDGTGGNPTVSITNPFNVALQGGMATRVIQVGPLNNGASSICDTSGNNLTGNQFSIFFIYCTSTQNLAYGIYTSNANANSAICTNITQTGCHSTISVGGQPSMTNDTSGASKSFQWLRMSHYS